jgi:hypothetical protein
MASSHRQSHSLRDSATEVHLDPRLTLQTSVFTVGLISDFSFGGYNVSATQSREYGDHFLCRRSMAGITREELCPALG